MDVKKAIALLEQFRKELAAWSRSDMADESLRSSITKKLLAVRQLVAELGLNKTLTVMPPPMIGGPIVRIAPLQDPFGSAFGDPYIKNAALRAAYLAADEGTAINSAHLRRGARAEYETMGKVSYQGAA